MEPYLVCVLYKPILFVDFPHMYVRAIEVIQEYFSRRFDLHSHVCNLTSQNIETYNFTLVYLVYLINYVVLS